MAPPLRELVQVSVHYGQFVEGALKPNEQKAFDFAADSCKQVIALATGVLALSVTFLKDVIEPHSVGPVWILYLSWGLLLLSVFFGVWTMLALTGSLQPRVDTKKPTDTTQPAAASSAESFFSINERNVTRPALLQVLSFVIGLGLIVFFGAYTFSGKPQKHRIIGPYIIQKTTYSLGDSVRVDTIEVK